jgi:hypothetical protein
LQTRGQEVNEWQQKASEECWVTNNTR